MNIADRAGLHCELHPVLKPGGRLAFYDPLAAEGHPDLTYPVPWAQTEETSSLLTAQEMTRALNKPVRYAPLEIDDFAARLTAAGRPAYLIQHLRHVAMDYQAGRFAGRNDIVARVGRVPGTTVERFTDKHRAAFVS